MVKIKFWFVFVKEIKKWLKNASEATLKLLNYHPVLISPVKQYAFLKVWQRSSEDSGGLVSDSLHRTKGQIVCLDCFNILQVLFVYAKMGEGWEQATMNSPRSSQSSFALEELLRCTY